MRMREATVLLASVALAACAAGAPSLSYGVPSPPSRTYVVGDTIGIAVQGLGQSLEIAARSAATYTLRYEPAGSGVRVRATVNDLAADVALPMGEPMAMDESALEGDFVFELDARGRATSLTSPHATAIGGQVFSAPVVAHEIFPRLSGGAVSAGESWTDSVTYTEAVEGGETEVTSNLTYTVADDVQRGGRALTEITFAGTAAVKQDLNVDGARVTQASELEVEGRLLWDVAAGVLAESETTMRGPGTVRIALLPGAELPTRVTWTTRVVTR